MNTLHHTLRCNATAYYRDLRHKPIDIPPAQYERWAAAVRRGSIFFYDTREVAIGLKNIDWSGSHIDHQEWVAQLNRFPALRPLCAAWQASGDIEYPRLARCLIEDWIDQHTYGTDLPLTHRDNTLNLSVRLGQSGGNGWLPMIANFNCPEVFDEPFLKRVAESCVGQLDYLRHHLKPVGNWRISQLDTLLTTSILLPEYCSQYRKFAIRHLNETFHRQIHADGSHQEHTPSYHGWMCHVFTAFWYLSKAQPDLGLSFDAQRVAKMWDYHCLSSTPDDGSSGIHDGSCWMPQTKKNNQRSHLWNMRREVAIEANLPDPDLTDAAQPSRCFESAGQLYLRTDMSPDAEMVTFDATRWGGGHCHLSRNAITLFSGGRMLLYDPGIFSYQMSDPLAAYGKSTPAHNTLNIDLMNQSDANPDLHDVALLKGADIVSSTYGGGFYPGTYTWGWYNGHHPGLFASHTRTLLWLHNRCAIIWDHCMFDRNGQMYGIHWQFPAGPSGCDPTTRRAWSATPDARNILVQELGGHDDFHTFISEGDKETPGGWLPTDHMGGHQPAPQARFYGHANNTTATTAITLLLPFDGSTPPPITPQRLTAGSGIWGFRFTLPNNEELVVAAADALKFQVNNAGPITTDASLAAVILRNNKPIHSVGHRGMYLEYQGQTLIDKPDANSWSLPHR